MSLRDADATPYAIPGPAGLPRAAPRAASAAPAARSAAAARFATPAWAAALAGLRPPLAASLALLRARALAGDTSKAPVLPVLLATLTRIGKGAVAVLADPTGSLPATLHAAALEQHGPALRPGAVLILAHVCAVPGLDVLRASGFHRNRAAGVEMSLELSNITVIIDPDAEADPATSLSQANPLLLYLPAARAPRAPPPKRPSSSRKRPRASPLAAPMRVGGGGPGLHARAPPPPRAPPRSAPPPVPIAQTRPRAPPVVSEEALDDLLGDIDIEAAIAASGRATEAPDPAPAAAAAVSAAASGDAYGGADDDDDLLGDFDIDAMVAAATQAPPAAHASPVARAPSVPSPQTSTPGSINTNRVAAVSSREDSNARSLVGKDRGLPSVHAEFNGGSRDAAPNVSVAERRPSDAQPAAVAVGEGQKPLSRASSVLDLLGYDADFDVEDEVTCVEGEKVVPASVNKAVLNTEGNVVPSDSRALKTRRLTTNAADGVQGKVDDDRALAEAAASGKENCFATAKGITEPIDALRGSDDTNCHATARVGASEEMAPANASLQAGEKAVAAPVDVVRSKRAVDVPDDAMIDDLTDDLGDDDFGDF